MRPKGPHEVLVNNQVKQARRRPPKVKGYDTGIKRCPMLMGRHHIYIQTRKVKQLHLTVGGHAYLFPNTSLVIKCPVRKFPKTYIKWLKDGSPLPSSKHVGITPSGSLKIHFLGAQDIGVYKCIAGPASDIFTLQLIGIERRSSDTMSTARPGLNWMEMLPSCSSHNSYVGYLIPRDIVSLLPSGEQDAFLQPRVEERLINITMQADRGELQQVQASELISSLLTHMPAAQLWTRNTKGGGQAKGK